MNKRRLKRIAYTLLITFVIILAPRHPTYAGSINVDVNDGGCVTGTQPDPYSVTYCSIQDAIDDAAPGDTLFIADGEYDENLSITIDLTLQGVGRELTHINGDGTTSVVYTNSADVTIQGVRIQGGGGQYGGGIMNDGTLELIDSEVSNNTLTIATAHGAGIYNDGTLTIHDSSINFNASTVTLMGGGISNWDAMTLQNVEIRGNGNTSTSHGGGIYSYGATVVIEGCVIRDNEAVNGAGGIHHGNGSMTISNTTLRGNDATGSANGGGIRAYGDLTLEGVTLAYNTAGDSGGGLAIEGVDIHVTLTNVTVSGNTALYAGGIYQKWAESLELNNATVAYNQVYSGGSYGGIAAGNSEVILRNSIIAFNQDRNCTTYSGGVFTSNGYNIEDTNWCSLTAAGDQPNTDPQLGTLENHLGPTPTHTLLVGSPAIDAGNPFFPKTNPDACAITDQRGFTRPEDGDGVGGARCDIGAYERLEPTFDDVPMSYWAYDSVEAIYYAGITSGCGGGNYCPVMAVSRAQMAKFLLIAEHGSAYTPPAGTGMMFGDVPPGHLFVDWIEQLANEGITSGCGGGNYCPDLPVSRAQMAKFLLIAEHGSGYSPPAGTGAMFLDVGPGHLFVDWIEQLASEGVTSGCGGGNYCPDYSVARDQMAVFLVRTFDLPIP